MDLLTMANVTDEGTQDLNLEQKDLEHGGQTALKME